MNSVDQVVQRLRDKVWAECDSRAIISAGPSEAPKIVAGLANRFLSSGSAGEVDPLLHGKVIDGVVAATLGLGPIQALLADPSVSEIMVNGASAVFVERHGRIEKVEACFEDDEHVLLVMDRILAPIGRRIDTMSPLVDARLSDGSRVNAVIPPLAVDGPILTIRRFVAVASSLDDLVRIGSMEAVAAIELERLVLARKNVVVVGGTSTGKTTLLSAALAATADTDRLIILEDAAEIPIQHPHAIRLESRPKAPEGAIEVGMTTLVKNALRMRPDRIIVGEVRGSEAWDLLQALNTGHRGSWTTLHANGAVDALLRLESLVLSASSGMPHSVIRTNIARAIDALVVLERDSSGSRYVASIDHVEPVEARESTEWRLNRIYEREAWA